MRLSSSHLLTYLLVLQALWVVGCSEPAALEDRERVDYPTRCASLLDGRAFKLTAYIDGRERERYYCIFVAQTRALQGPVDGAGSGGGGTSACARLEETPHQHDFAGSLESVCASGASLSQDETEALVGQLETFVDVPAPTPEPGPNDPMTSNIETTPDTTCARDISCGRRELGQNPQSLYACRAGVFEYLETCEQECAPGVPGQPDACVGSSDLSEICSGPTNGLYCGQTLGLEQGVLYRCDDGVAQVNERCAAGCELMPPGEHDRCLACAAGNGLYCGDAQGQNTSLLYRCTDGVYRVEQVCDYGCAVAAPGFDDACSADSTCFPEQEGQVIVERPWGACQEFTSICGTDGTQSRTVGVCRAGQIVQEEETQACTRQTQGLVISEGEWSPCAFETMCAESGTQTQLAQVCDQGQLVEREQMRSCERQTQWMSCGGGNVCSEEMCVPEPACDATGFWTPGGVTVSDTEGTQVDQMIPVEIALELRDKGTDGALEFRVCKSEANMPSPFAGDPIHVYFEEWATHAGLVMIDRIVTTSPASACTSWVDMDGESMFIPGDLLAGQVRILSPASVEPQWGRWCSFVGMPGGTCFYANTSVMVRTCR